MLLCDALRFLLRFDFSENDFWQAGCLLSQVNAMIHQFYATHCTYGSSALIRPADRKPELSNSPLGYSVRAGSLGAEPLKKIYRMTESLLYYYLPEDVPSENKAKQDAQSAPCRFCYVPSIDGFPAAIRCCYRSQDTAGRVGSYFCHVLIDAQKQPWNSLDVLRLWESPDWVSEDSGEIDSPLLPLPSFFDPTMDENRSVGDSSFLAFLQGRYQPRSRFSLNQNASSSVTPELFMRFLNGVLDCWDEPQKKFILVADPAVAALFFYGALRLLPAGMGTTSAFSTYENNPLQFPGRFCATVFDDPLKRDVSPELYHAGHFVLNTFTQQQTPCRQIEGNYCRQIVRTLLSGGWDAVDRYRSGFTGLGLHKTTELDALAGMDQVSDSILAPVFEALSRTGNKTGLGGAISALASGSISGKAAGNLPADDSGWRRNKLNSEYLQKRISEKLERLDITDSTVGALLRPLVGTPGHLTILELFGTQSGTPKMNAAVLFLLKSLPCSMVSSWLKFPNAREDSKIVMLLKYITPEGALPPGSEKLIFEGEQTALLAKILVQMDPPRRLAFWNRYSGAHKLEIIGGYAQAVAYHKGDVEPLERRIGELEGRELVELHRKYGDAFFLEYPIFSTTMGEKLGELSKKFFDFDTDFAEYFKTLSAGSHLMSEACQERVYNWGRLKTIAGNILQAQENGSVKTDKLETDLQDLLTRFEGATSGTGFEERAVRSRRLFLQRVIRALFPENEGFKPFLPVPNKRNEGLWGKIEWRLELNQWPKSTPKLGSLSGILGGQGLTKALSSANSGGASVSIGSSSTDSSSNLPKVGSVPVPPPVSGDLASRLSGGSSEGGARESGSFGGNLQKPPLPELPLRGLPEPMIPGSIDAPPKARGNRKIRLTPFQGFLLCTSAVLFLLVAIGLLIWFQSGLGNRTADSSTVVFEPENGSGPLGSNRSDLAVKQSKQQPEPKNGGAGEVLDAAGDSEKGEDASGSGIGSNTTKTDKWVDAPESEEPIFDGSSEVSDPLDQLAAELSSSSEKDATIMAQLQSLKTKAQYQTGEEIGLLKDQAKRVSGLVARLSFDSDSGNVYLVDSRVVDAVDVKNLQLGPGYINVGGKLFVWAPGDVFNPEKPVSEYRFRELEKALGLEELKIALVHEETDVQLTIVGKAPAVKVSKKEKGEQEATLKVLEDNYEILFARLKEYNSDKIESKAKEKILQILAQMVQVNYTPVSQEPQRSAFGAREEAYQGAMEQYRLQVEAQAKIRRSIVPKVEETLKALETQIGQKREQTNEAQKLADEAGQKTVKKLLESVREVGFVVYCPNGFRKTQDITQLDEVRGRSLLSRTSGFHSAMGQSGLSANTGNRGNESTNPKGEAAVVEPKAEPSVAFEEDPFGEQSDSLAEPGTESKNRTREDQSGNVPPSSGLILPSGTEENLETPTVEIEEDPFAEPEENEAGIVAPKPERLAASRPGNDAAGVLTVGNSEPNTVDEREEKPLGEQVSAADESGQATLGGVWKLTSVKPDRSSTNVPGVLAMAKINVRNQGGSNNSMLYGKWYAKVRKQYSVFSQIVLVQGKRLNQRPEVEGLTFSHPVLVGTSGFAVRFRFASKVDPTKVFYSPWYKQRGVDINSLYNLQYELDESSIDRLLEK